MAAKLDQLVDKVDVFEIVRDQIAAILLTETTEQMQLALSALPPRDPEQWHLRIFSERTNPFGEFLDAPDQDDPLTPIVNVSYDGTTFEKRSSNVVQEQRGESTFHIDCYTCAASEDDGTGHKPADESAAKEAQRVVRLVRNYLMAGTYTYLGLRGTVYTRWISGIEMFRPALDAAQVQRIGAARITLQVSHSEFSPQVTGQPMDTLSVNVARAPNGELSFFDMTLSDAD